MRYINKLLLSTILVLLVIIFCKHIKDKFTPDYWDRFDLNTCSGALKDDYLNNGGITIYDNFITDEEIEEVKRLAKGRLKRATVFGKEGIIESNVRTNTTCFRDIKNNPILKNLTERVSKLTGYPVENQEDLQIVHYNGGEYYKQHFDDCWENSKACNDDHKRGGHRRFTALMYLNDVPKGGETDFPALGIKVKPKKGRVALFQPTIERKDGSVINHPCSLHAALPPENGEKMTTTIWSRQGKFY